MRRRIRYLPAAVRIGRGAGYSTTLFLPGLVDLACFPELEGHVDPREIEEREDGAWRFVVKA